MDPTRSPLRGVNYALARRLLVAVGVGVLGVLALVMYARRVETVEVLAVLLFVPVFLALLRWDLAGGIAAAAVATVAYIALRASAIEAVGASRFTGLIVARGIGYFVFGVLGGWANAYSARVADEARPLRPGRRPDRPVQRPLLHPGHRFRDGPRSPLPARSSGSSCSTSRPRRSNDFTVGHGEAPARPGPAVSARALRQVDRMVHSRTEAHHRLAAILPETGPEGARVFAGRLADSGGRVPRRRGVELEVGALQPRALTYPDDEDVLAAVAARLRHDRPRRAPGGVRADSLPVSWDERQRALAARLSGRPLTALEQGTLVVIPSTTFPSVELRKITGIEHYEERMLFTAAAAAPARAAPGVRHCGPGRRRGRGLLPPLPARSR